MYLKWSATIGRRWPLLASLVLFLATLAPALHGGGNFLSLFDGTTLKGWTLVGPSRIPYVARDGMLVCPQGCRANLFTEAEYGDFVLRFEFRLSPGTNNGVGIRAPLQGRISRVGMEIQILDDADPKNARLKPAQYHGSIYEVVPAKRGALKPTGEWNEEEIRAVGRQVRVTLNGTTILDANLSQVTDPEILRLHPGLQRERGHIGFLGHGSEVAFRNLRLQDLAGPKPGDSPKP